MTGRNAERALLAGILVLVAALAAGCGVQPSGVITGSPARGGPSEGVGLYLIRNGTLTLVVRSATEGVPPVEALRLLAAGPDVHEQGEGFTSEVPADALPASEVVVSADRSRLSVTLSGAVTTLSAAAVDQIVCTLDSAAAAASRGQRFAAVTLSGPDGDLKPQFCPLY
ncbi:hypothetical protein C5N14_12660 [Micromonospora sp. MW-13]|uniref:hypothetical protein n=1 Tax=Micromonospora sp. MW-13 TaxID=2094022 RepID=UPI000ED5010E|nr:hypothetical protein [Micromonospora sp. MW-13]RGC68615.1 hypothetical protein C5N14_12660 [Micromonospora sp. MW-13]